MAMEEDRVVGAWCVAFAARADAVGTPMIGAKGIVRPSEWRLVGSCCCGDVHASHGIEPST